MINLGVLVHQDNFCVLACICLYTDTHSVGDWQFYQASSDDLLHFGHDVCWREKTFQATYLPYWCPTWLSSYGILTPFTLLYWAAGVQREAEAQPMVILSLGKPQTIKTLFKVTYKPISVCHSGNFISQFDDNNYRKLWSPGHLGANPTNFVLSF